MLCIVMCIVVCIATHMRRPAVGGHEIGLGSWFNLPALPLAPPRTCQLVHCSTHTPKQRTLICKMLAQRGVSHTLILPSSLVCTLERMGDSIWHGPHHVA